MGYYSYDHCYGVIRNQQGEWKMISDCYKHHHQLELIFNFPGGYPSLALLQIALDFVLDPAPLPPPPSSAYIAITPVLNAPSETPANATTTNPYNQKADMSVVESSSEKKPVEIARSEKAGSIFGMAEI